METLKLIFMAILLTGISDLSAQAVWQTSTQNYNGNEYIIEDSKYIRSVTNKKYASFNDNATSDIEFEGEREETFLKRSEGLMESIYKVANEVFDFGNIPVSRKSLYRLSLVCYFDSKTKNYVGAYFVFDTQVKNYITLQKLNLLESKLLQANLNAGTTNMKDPNEKYFIKEIDIPIGR